MADEGASKQSVDTAVAAAEAFRPPLPAMPAPKRPMMRRIPVRVRGPFLPDHHGHARHGLKGEHK